MQKKKKKRLPRTRSKTLTSPLSLIGNTVKTWKTCHTAYTYQLVADTTDSLDVQCAFILFIHTLFILVAPFPLLFKLFFFSISLSLFYSLHNNFGHTDIFCNDI